jgi:hypothetical protein
MNALRGGPLDEQGVGARLLDARGPVDPEEVPRRRAVANEKLNHGGPSKLSLGYPALRCCRNANFARAAGHQRTADRTLTTGGWPVLLRVIVREGLDGRYLGLQEVIDRFKNRRFPERMNKRLRAGSCQPASLPTHRLL